MLTVETKRPSGTVAMPSHTDDRDEPQEGTTARWLGLVRPDRVVDTPGLFGQQVLESSRRLEHPQGPDEHLLYFMVSGSCTATAGPDRWNLDAGSVLWIRPGTPFSIATPDDRGSVVYLLRISADEEGSEALAPALCIPDVWEVRGLFDLLVTELDTALPHRDKRIQGLLLVLFTSLFRRADQYTEPGVLSPSARQAIEKFADDNITGRPSVADLAQVAGLSPDYFTRTFRKTFGIPPREWLVRRRIQHAAAHLNESRKSIAQVAVAYGYQDSFLFSRQFKSVMGIPPQAYRAR
ncbi:AraC family transcriptional regulator [Streptomyces sp. NPDC048270]|uniref:helix-turn-helix domain-containing protein n=1 Tax=Streptomyces sp. NPDC048270 TaxID=3154615 RepID=UPI00340BEA40